MIKEHVERYATEGGRAINEGDWEAYGDFFSEDLVMRTPAIPGISRGREARVSLVQGMMAAVPDGHVEMVRSIVQGDRACLEWHWTGTNVDGRSVRRRPNRRDQRVLRPTGNVTSG